MIEDGATVSDKNSEQDLLRVMLTSRECDRKNGILTRQSKAWFTISSSGHEAMAAIQQFLQPEDVLVPHYRDQALMLARGVSIADIARNVMGKATAQAGGRNMSAHFCHRDLNIFSIASPTGSQCLPAAGMAWAKMLSAESGVVICVIGDAATRQGEFYEAVCFAHEKKLPIVFVVADNKYGVSTNTSTQLPFRLNIFAEACYCLVNGAEVDAVADSARSAIERARAGEGPSMLWLEMDRLDSHTSSDDHRHYRTPDELKTMRDPIELYEKQLIDEGKLSEQELNALRASVTANATEIYRQIVQESDPHSEHAEEWLYQPSAASRAVEKTEQTFDTMLAAFNAGLHAALQQPNVVLFGEDIEDPKGGVFKITQGLSTVFPGKVINSPLAEATIFGAAAGLAAAGMRPIVELQFVDFIGPAWNQLQNQISTLSWRSNGRWSCPVIMYAPYGGYLPGGGIWHSQSNESLFTHLPGLEVIIPSNPRDAFDRLQGALQRNNPVLFLLPKHRLRQKISSSDYDAIEYQQARYLKRGNDITLVTWGNGVEISCAAETSCPDFSIEIIDLVSLNPCDCEAVKTSLAKTGRLVVVQEDNVTSSFGASLIATLMNQADSFYDLLSSPQLVARRDVHIGFHPNLERAVLPTQQQVVEALQRVMSEEA